MVTMTPRYTDSTEQAAWEFFLHMAARLNCNDQDHMARVAFGAVKSFETVCQTRRESLASQSIAEKA